MNGVLRILLVEDEPVDVMTVRRALRTRSLPVELSVAESAEEALERLETARRAAADGIDAPSPDLVLADLRLPKLSGLDLLERLKLDPALRRIPFVLFSTSSQESEVSRAYDLGAAGYYVKPMAFEDYSDTVEQIVGYWLRAQPAVVSTAPRVEPGGAHYLQAELHTLLEREGVGFEYLDESATDGIWYWDLQHPDHEWMSPGFWQTFGYDPETRPHLVSSWQDIVDPEDLAVAMQNFEKHCADPNHPYDQVVRYRHRTGSTVWIRCRGVAIRDEEGAPVRMLGVHTDVTGVKAAELELETSRRKLEAIEDLVPAGPGKSSGGVGVGEEALVWARIRAVLKSEDLD